MKQQPHFFIGSRLEFLKDTHGFSSHGHFQLVPAGSSLSLLSSACSFPSWRPDFMTDSSFRLKPESIGSRLPGLSHQLPHWHEGLTPYKLLQNREDWKSWGEPTIHSQVQGIEFGIKNPDLSSLTYTWPRPVRPFCTETFLMTFRVNLSSLHTDNSNSLHNVYSFSCVPAQRPFMQIWNNSPR